MNSVLRVIRASTAVLVVAYACGALAQSTLYGATGATTTTSNLVLLSDTTGAQIGTIGPIGYAITGLAVHPTTGVLYGATSNKSASAPHSLITINKSTGAGTVVGSFTSGGQAMADITFTSDGTLYGWLEPSTDSLYTINLATGTATLVGNASISTSGSGLAANGADVLYYAGFEADGTLRTVNRATGLTTVVATLSGAPAPSDAEIAALAFSPSGTLYAVHLDSGSKAARLITINPATGVVTDLGPSITALDAIAFDGAAAPPPPVSANVPVPVDAPMMLVLMALLLAGAGWLALRRHG